MIVNPMLINLSNPLKSLFRDCLTDRLHLLGIEYVLKILGTRPKLVQELSYLAGFNARLLPIIHAAPANVQPARPTYAEGKVQHPKLWLYCTSMPFNYASWTTPHISTRDTNLRSVMQPTAQWSPRGNCIFEKSSRYEV